MEARPALVPINGPIVDCHRLTRVVVCDMEPALLEPHAAIGNQLILQLRCQRGRIGLPLEYSSISSSMSDPSTGRASPRHLFHRPERSDAPVSTELDTGRADWGTNGEHD